MDCTLASSIILFGGVAFGALVGFITEHFLVSRGLYKPTNHFAIWQAKRGTLRAIALSQTV